MVLAVCGGYFRHWGGLSGCKCWFFGVLGVVCGVLCVGCVFGCFPMWGKVIFSLVRALCTLVQILIFGG